MSISNNITQDLYTYLDDKFPELGSRVLNKVGSWQNLLHDDEPTLEEFRIATICWEIIRNAKLLEENELDSE